MAPPSTPAQPRFLLSKRQAPQSQKPTATPLQAGPHQFASTPRFHVPATPRQTSHQPPLFSTPGASTARPPRATQYEPLSDSIDTSPISSDLPGDEGRDRGPVDESIEIESPPASRSLSEEDGRPPKRRRVSISPEADPSPADDTAHQPMMVDDEPIDIDSTQPLDDDNVVPMRSPVHSDEPMTDSEGPPSPPTTTTEPPARHHPTFRSAPRFKAAEKPAAEGSHQSRPPLPDAFSPQRRGAKYVPGGLAAEVRDWLVQVKGASEYDRPAGASVRVTVDEARAGNGVWVVAAREADDEDGDDGTLVGGQGEGVPGKVILAGDGRITGLGGGNGSVVREGGTVAMYQPMWDITLSDLGQFAVACDWEVSG